MSDRSYLKSTVKDFEPLNVFGKVDNLYRTVLLTRSADISTNERFSEVFRYVRDLILPIMNKILNDLTDLKPILLKPLKDIDDLESIKKFRRFHDRLFSLSDRILNVIDSLRKVEDKFNANVRDLIESYKEINLNCVVFQVSYCYLDIVKDFVFTQSGYHTDEQLRLLKDVITQLLLKLINIGKHHTYILALMNEADKLQISEDQSENSIDMFVIHSLGFIYEHPIESARLLKTWLLLENDLINGDNLQYRKKYFVQLSVDNPGRFCVSLNCTLLQLDYFRDLCSDIFLNWKIGFLAKYCVLESIIESESMSFLQTSSLIMVLIRKWASEDFVENWVPSAQSELTIFIVKLVENNFIDFETESITEANKTFLLVQNGLSQFLKNNVRITRINGLKLAEVLTRKIRKKDGDTVLTVPELQDYEDSNRYPEGSYHYLLVYLDVYYYKTKAVDASGLIVPSVKSNGEDHSEKEKPKEEVVKVPYNPWQDSDEESAEADKHACVSDSDDDSDFVETLAKHAAPEKNLVHHNRAPGNKRLKYLIDYIEILGKETEDMDIYYLALSTLEKKIYLDPLELNLYVYKLTKVLLALGNKYALSKSQFDDKKQACLVAVLYMRPLPVITVFRETFFSRETDLGVKGSILAALHQGVTKLSNFELIQKHEENPQVQNPVGTVTKRWGQVKGKGVGYIDNHFNQVAEKFICPFLGSKPNLLLLMENSFLASRFLYTLAYMISSISDDTVRIKVIKQVYPLVWMLEEFTTATTRKAFIGLIGTLVLQGSIATYYDVGWANDVLKMKRFLLKISESDSSHECRDHAKFMLSYFETPDIKEDTWIETLTKH